MRPSLFIENEKQPARLGPDGQNRAEYCPLGSTARLYLN